MHFVPKLTVHCPIVEPLAIDISVAWRGSFEASTIGSSSSVSQFASCLRGWDLFDLLIDDMYMLICVCVCAYIYIDTDICAQYVYNFPDI